MRYRKGDPLVRISPLRRLIGDMLVVLICAIGWPLSRALYRIEIERGGARNSGAMLPRGGCTEWSRDCALPRRAILVSNHCMPLDPLFHSMAILPRRTFYTLLEETCEAPLLGSFVRILGGIPLPRSGSRLEDIEGAVAYGLRTRGFAHFYPEGECFLGNQRILPFKAGAAYFAIKFAVPVVPIVTVLRRAHGPRSKLIRVAIRVLPPVEPPNLRPALAPLRAGILPSLPEGAADSSARALLVASIRFTRKIHDSMQAEIERAGGDPSLYRGPMPRIRGVND